MSSASTKTNRRFLLWEILPAIVVAVSSLVWIVPALADLTPDDLRILYQGGVAAWQSGHPEFAPNWLSTALLALTMALVTRVLSLTHTVIALNTLNLILIVATTATVWFWLRGRVSRLWWWSTLALVLAYSPTMSTVRWKQLNWIVLGLALAGFAWIRRGRTLRGAGALALSLALKPLAIVLPLALLSRRDTRRAALWCFAFVVALTVAGQGFLALRARDASQLSPFPVLRNFGKRAAVFQVEPENFSPDALLRRLTHTNTRLQRTVVLLAVVLAALLANESIRRQPGTSWEVFAFALLVSTMAGPVSWSHYQVLLLPMFVLLAYRFAAEGAGAVWWLTLLFAYGLASLVQRPLELTVPGALITLATGRRERWEDVVQVLMLSQFAPYFLYLAAFGWFNRKS